MKSPTQEDLLGYLLGALEPDETVRIQQGIDSSPELETRLLALKGSLAPLESLNEPTGGCPGLARRTSQAIAASRRLMPSEKLAVAPAFSARDSYEFRGGWSFADFMMACTAAAIVGALLFPAIAMSRFNSKVTACQGNLQTLFHSMVAYAEMNDGEFIKIPDSGSLSVAGCFGPILKDAGLLESDQLLQCAGVSTDEPVVVPTVNEVRSASTIAETLSLQRKMGGHYGYALGHADNGIYRAPRSMGRANYALLADSPTITPGNTRRSANHGRAGQNVLFEGGRVAFVKSPIIGTDELFYNDLRLVAPGIHAADSVVAPSNIHPIKIVWQ